MDSIVDTFFPLIEFIEAEADDIDSFLANPLRVYENASDLSPAVPAGKGRRYLTALRKYLHNLKPVWLHVRTPQVVQFFGVIKDTAISTQRESDFSHLGEAKAIRRPESAPKTMSRKALRGVNEDLYDRGKMLSRIAVSRKLVMGLSRLLISKSDVVRGLRKRLKDENNRLGSNEPGQRHDIGIYLGDLQGESSVPILEVYLSSFILTMHFTRSHYYHAANSHFLRHNVISSPPCLSWDLATGVRSSKDWQR